MKIELKDRDFWLTKCAEAREHIKEQRIKNDAERFEYVKEQRRKSFWYKLFRGDINAPIKYDLFDGPSDYGWYGLQVIKNLESMLKAKHTGTITLNEKEWSWIR